MFTDVAPHGSDSEVAGLPASAEQDTADSKQLFLAGQQEDQEHADVQAPCAQLSAGLSPFILAALCCCCCYCSCCFACGCFDPLHVAALTLCSVHLGM